MTTANEVLKTVNKKYGSEVVVSGIKVHNRERLPTGVFAFDLATGGGFPKGKVSILYGAESSLKTTLALKAIARMQDQEPDKKCVLIDLEVSYDAVWGAQLGVNNDKLIRVLPDYAEQAVDIVEAFLDADDVAMIVVDSLAAMIPAVEADTSAEKAQMGNAGLVIGKMYRKITVALSRAERNDRNPVVILINQVRQKIGVMYGDPEVMPGGFAPKFMSSLTVRLYGKDEVDKDVHPNIPAWKVCTGTIKKYKVPIAAKNLEFRMAAVPIKGAFPLSVGASNDWPTILSYLKSTGMLEKHGNKGWALLGEVFPKQIDIRTQMDQNPKYSAAVQKAIIEAVSLES